MRSMNGVPVSSPSPCVKLYLYYYFLKISSFHFEQEQEGKINPGYLHISSVFSSVQITQKQK